ncbi:hypothetical protein ACFY30_01255 [Streptomyces sp. NPDC000345]|uniref:hypothetical protein n=1 Tax=Streptomyces sp. NPDC000345 TaxID=3364537 RepID=UPI0036C8D7A2
MGDEDQGESAFAPLRAAFDDPPAVEGGGEAAEGRSAPRRASKKPGQGLTSWVVSERR